jgi:hypothetical protein
MTGRVLAGGHGADGRTRDGHDEPPGEVEYGISQHVLVVALLRSGSAR